MAQKTGRNDPCPCGSGKKLKQCCALQVQVSTVKSAPSGATERVVDWLMSRHRKAVRLSIDEMLYQNLNAEDKQRLESLDDEAWQGIQLNATEWLIAEGRLLIEGESQRVADLLLGSGGPVMTAEQRQWISQISQRPLRLYDIMDVDSGRQMTLRDSLDTSAAPVVLQESFSRLASLTGTRIGARVMEVDGRHELSGSVYLFSRPIGASIVAAMKDAAEPLRDRPEALPAYLSYLIRRQWIAQLILGGDGLESRFTTL